MKRFFLPVIVVLALAAMLSTTALAQPGAAPAPLPANTASPRDWEKYAPDGKLLPSKIKSDNAILMDAKTGEVLFEKDADMQRYPASITKIMTGLLAMESGKDMSELVTVGKLPPLGDPAATRISLIQGETLTFEQLMYGLMNQSGNDAANAIAIYLDGSVQAFVDRMNARAKELGMTNTRYTNPNGLQNTEHYTTARDMAILTREVMKYPAFVKIVSQFKYTMPATNRHSDARTWTNHNKLIDPSSNEIFSYTYATGVKTGYTSDSLYNLVATADKDGQQLIAVVLHGKGIEWKYPDTITMFEYGFQFYDTVDLQDLLADKVIPAPIKNAASTDPGNGTLDLVMRPQGQAFITDTRDVIRNLKADPSQFQQTMEITKDTAPIKRNELVGTITFYYEGNPKLVCDLLAARDVEEMPTPAPSVSAMPTSDATAGASNSAGPGVTASPQPVNGGAGSIIVWVAVAMLLLVLAVLTIRFFNMQRRNRRYRQYNYRQGNNAKLRR